MYTQLTCFQSELHQVRRLHEELNVPIYGPLIRDPKRKVPECTPKKQPAQWATENSFRRSATTPKQLTNRMRNLIMQQNYWLHIEGVPQKQ